MVTMTGMLGRKVLRDLRTMRTQVLSIALLVAAGAAVLVMSVSNHAMLVRAQDDHYARERFADVFVSLERAPVATAGALRRIDGVASLDTRVVAPVRIERREAALPIAGRIVSLPPEGQPGLNRLALRGGSWIDPRRGDQVLVNEAFAQGRDLRPGDTLRVILHGRAREFEMAGIVLSPEFVFAARPGDPLPDDRNYAVLWAAAETVAAAFDMSGAFNDVLLTLAPGANEAHVLAELDRALARFGGTGAIGRRDHPSHRFLEDELAEQRTLAIVAPALFFGIAAFLLAVVVGRMVEAQREQIAVLKALGFPAGPILGHYCLFVGVIAIAGAIAGAVAGHLLAIAVAGSYRAFFRFPVLEHRLELWPVAIAIVGSLFAALAAAAKAVTGIVLMPAAMAMRTPPPRLRPGAPAVWSGSRWPVRWRLAVRGVFARPVRAALSVLGVGLSMPLVVIGLFWFDALDFMTDMAFERIQRGDAIVVMNDAVPASIVARLAASEGVLLAEGYRVVPALLRVGHRSQRTTLTGLEIGAELDVPRLRDYSRAGIPAEGLLLGRRLADRLQLRIGDMVTVEVRGRTRPVGEITLAAIADDVLGMTATMSLDALGALLREGPRVDAVSLRIDAARGADVLRRLARAPAVAATSSKAERLGNFRERLAGLIRIGAVTLTAFGGLIVVGIVYNIARVAFHERASELAGLRVLGFTTGEVAGILFAEFLAIVAAGIALGVGLSGWVVRLVLSARSTESFDVPPVIAPATFAIAALAVLAAAAASVWIVRWRVDRMDLVAVLKARE
jgi:putative ABC transport system permease protein